MPLPNYGDRTGFFSVAGFGVLLIDLSIAVFWGAAICLGPGVIGVGAAEGTPKAQTTIEAEPPMASAPGFRELHRDDVADAVDVEVVMGHVERLGGWVSQKHYHPGGEFGFVLGGSVVVSTEGQPETTLETGASFYQPPGEWHVVRSSPEGAKAVVFRVLQKGQPMLVEVD